MRMSPWRARSVIPGMIWGKREAKISSLMVCDCLRSSISVGDFKRRTCSMEELGMRVCEGSFF